MDKLAVIFPGVGYTAQKPVLYYAKRLAEQAGWQVVEAQYGPLPMMDPHTAQGQDDVFAGALAEAERSVGIERLTGASRLLFLSKSIGTCAACALQRKYNLAAENVYFTPVRMSLPLLEAGSLVIMGDNDPWAETALAEQAAAAAPFRLEILPGANHSLETGDVLRDMRALQKVMESVKKFLA